MASPNYMRGSLRERFWHTATAAIGASHECWDWPGTRIPRGYGQIADEGGKHRKMLSVHRLVHEWWKGPIPEGHVIDHLCRRPQCFNPAHLEAVTQSENVLRGTGPALARDRITSKTHCPQGHPYSGDNLYMHPNGGRVCRECVRESGRRYRRRKAG